MSNPLDPFGWFKGTTDSLGKIGSTASPWIDRWVDATTWWADTDNWAQLVNDPMQPLELILVELADGITRQFSGRTVRLRRGTDETRLVIGSMRVERTAGSASVTKVRARADVLDVALGGRQLEAVDIVANEVTLAPGVPTRLIARDIDLTVKVRADEIIAWVHENDTSGWTFALDESGHLAARRPGWRASVLVQPTIRAGSVRFDLRGVSYDGLAAQDEGLPSWWRRARRAPVPGWLTIGHEIEVPMPPGRVLRGGWWDGEQATLQFHLDEHSEALDLRRLRSSVKRDDAVFTFDE
jgi:hypothetical protein